MARSGKDYSFAKQYLAKVLPWPQDGDPPGWIGIIYKQLGKEKDQHFWLSRGVTSVKEATGTLDWLESLADTRDIYVCMGALNSGQEKKSKRGHIYTIVTRQQEFVTGLKSLFMDLDYKGEPESYDTLEDALSALDNFRRLIQLPTPSIMVSSGGGVHVYWTFDRILSVDEWKPLAEALVAAALKHGIKFDTGCTTDHARVLRIPCTKNFKTDPVRDVTIHGDVLDFDYAVERIEQALAPFKGVARPRTVKHRFIEDPSLFVQRSPLDDNLLGAGYEAFDFPTPPLKDIAKVCPTIRNTVATGGKDQSEPFWYLMLQVATWTQEGEAAAHVMSHLDARYDKETVSDKYGQAVNVRIEKGLGWPQCATIAKDSKLCATCPHLKAGKSPLNFTLLPTPPPPALAPAGVPITQIDMPAGYTRDAAGYVLQSMVAKDGTPFQQRVCDYVLVNGYISQTEKGVTLNFTTSVQSGVTRTMQLHAGGIAQQDMRRDLQGLGLMLNDKEVKRMGEFLVAWIKKLQELKDAVTNTDPFGWAVVGAKVEGFAYGGTLYTPTGTRMAPLGDHAMAAHYTPVGSLQPWYDAVKLVHDQKRMALDVVIAAAFAAPLVRSTGQAGLLLSLYSIESGIGKTTTMKTAQAVWGDPVRAMQGLDDTALSVLNKLGKLKALPMFWDELKTRDDAVRMVNTLFTVTRGKERDRLKSNIERREAGVWDTLLVSASNESLVDFVVGKTKMTTAGIYRLFEFTVPPGSEGRIAVSDASRIIAALNTNFGSPGQVYAQFLGNNFDRIDQEVAAEMAQVGQEVDLQPDERYWGALVAIVTLGAVYANELRLTDFNLQELRAFMVDQFYAMRRLRDEQSVDMTVTANVANVLVQFLRDKRARNTLVTETMWMGRGKPAANQIKILGDASRLDALMVHASVKDKRLRLSLSSLQNWLEENGWSRHIFIEQLKSTFGAVRSSATLGAGTNYSTGVEFVLDIDMTQHSAKLYLRDLG